MQPYSATVYNGKPAVYDSVSRVFYDARNMKDARARADELNASHGMTKDQQFFFDHAGYSYNPCNETPLDGRKRAAVRLADAEARGRAAGLSFEWSIDPHTDSSDFDDSPEPWALWQVTCYNAEGVPVDSMHGVDFGRDGTPWGNPYRRVCEAEMVPGVLK